MLLLYVNPFMTRAVPDAGARVRIGAARRPETRRAQEAAGEEASQELNLAASTIVHGTPPGVKGHTEQRDRVSAATILCRKIGRVHSP